MRLRLADDSPTFPGWYVIGFVHGDGATMAVVVNDAGDLESAPLYTLNGYRRLKLVGRGYSWSPASSKGDGDELA